MAQGRMLQRRISKNDEIPRLIESVDAELRAPHGAYAALLFTWCIAHLDVEGRMHGDPRLVRAGVFPLLETVTTAHVATYLAHMAALKLVIWYEVKGRRYLAFPGFEASQPGLRKNREQDSDLPPPPDDAGNAPTTLRQRSGETPSEVEEKRKEVEEKRKEDAAPPLPALIPDLGKCSSKKQRAEVDSHLRASLRVLEALNAARKRTIPGSKEIRPTYDSLAGIAGRLAAGKTLDECLTVVANSEADAKANEKSRDYFDAISPWRPENFERRLAMQPKERAGPTLWQGKPVGMGGVDKPKTTGDLKI